METIGQLINLPNGMDLEQATIGSKTIDVFQPGDHDKLDSYLGIHSQAVTTPILQRQSELCLFRSACKPSSDPISNSIPANSPRLAML